VVACDDAFGYFFRDDCGADWEAVAECFGCGEDVGVG